MKMAMMLDDLFIKRRRSSLETAMWGAKLLVVCAGIVSTVVLLKAAIIPCVLRLTPQLWASFKTCCLSQLYIYIILNFIIITIIAASSSTSHRQNQNHHHPTSSSSSSVAPSYINNNINAPTTTDVDSKEIKDNSSSSIQSEDHELISWHDIHVVQLDHQQQSQESIQTSVMPPPTSKATTNTATLDEYDDHDHKFETSPDACSGDIFLTDSTRMPLPAKEEEEDVNTLDSTWKAIMEGQGNPIAKQLKKSETWDTPPRLTPQLGLKATIFKATQHQLAAHCNFDEYDEEVEDAVTWARRELKKSDTFSDRVSLRREKSMSQDELNQRAEAFIKKINNDIRLQRLESDQRRFREIVNSG